MYMYVLVGLKLNTKPNKAPPALYLIREKKFILKEKPRPISPRLQERQVVLKGFGVGPFCTDLKTEIMWKRGLRTIALFEGSKIYEGRLKAKTYSNRNSTSNKQTNIYLFAGNESRMNEAK